MHSVAHMLGAMNILLAALCGLVAGFYGWRLMKGRIAKDAEGIALGLMLFAGGWSLQRGYWAVNRALEAMGYDYLLTSVYKSTSWITLVPMTLVVIGSGYLLAPLLQNLMGAHWLPVFLVVMLCGWSALVAVL